MVLSSRGNSSWPTGFFFNMYFKNEILQCWLVLLTFFSYLKYEYPSFSKYIFLWFYIWIYHNFFTIGQLDLSHISFCLKIAKKSLIDKSSSFFLKSYFWEGNYLGQTVCTFYKFSQIFHQNASVNTICKMYF